MPRRNTISLPWPHPLLFVVLATALSSSGCSEGEGLGPGTGGGGGVPGSGGGASGGTAPTGGQPAAGGASGGDPGTGGLATGGMGTGGTASGGAGTGGTSTGGTSGGGGGAGGTAGAGGGGTGGTSGALSPCPEEGPCKILPLGDSITFGLGFDGGYRVELFHLAVSDGHDITFTGTQTPNGPMMVDGLPFPRQHAGISGQTIAQIDGRIPSPDLQELPHIVLVHAGTNDMYQNPSGAGDRLGSLIDKLVTEAPDALIVVSNIIPFPSSSANVAAFNADVVDVVQERIDAGKHVLFVDQFEGFPDSELGDGVHPNQAGYARMAGKWYAAIEAFLQ